MSMKITAQCTIRDSKLLEEALNKLGFAFSKDGSVMRISRNYHNIEINTANGELSFDNMDKGMVDKVQVEYMRKFAMKDIQSRGEMIDQIIENANEIRIIVA